MIEESINLGRQRLMISQELGNNFANAIEGLPSSEGHKELVESVKNHITQNPNTKIIGTELTPETTLSDVVISLGRQVGLPDPNLTGVKGRLIGREKDFLLVFPINGDPPDELVKKIVKKTKKLGIKTLTSKRNE